MITQWLKDKISSFVSKEQVKALYTIDENGLMFPFSEFENEKNWLLGAYIEQLEEEELVTALTNSWFLEWDQLYHLLENEEHASSIKLLSLPEYSDVKPELVSEGGLSSNDFQVIINQWRDQKTGKILSISRTGAVIKTLDDQYLLSNDVWQLIKSIKHFHQSQKEKPSEINNQIGWALVRKRAKHAQVKLDQFLEKTVVVKPDSLRMKIRKANINSMPVLEVEPSFEGQPETWIKSFDSQKEVQEKYHVLNNDGSVAHVLIEPEVKDVLESIKSFPGRRVGGDDALSFIRNPYAFIGENASTVLNPEIYENDLSEAGIFFHRFYLNIHQDADNKIESVDLILQPIGKGETDETVIQLTTSNVLKLFVNELEIKLAAGMPAGFWQGYELELSNFTENQFSEIKKLWTQWDAESIGAEFKAVLDLDKYGDRVTGIGEAEQISSPYLVKEESENWLPDDVINQIKDIDFSSNFDFRDEVLYSSFSDALDEARDKKEPVTIPNTNYILPFELAEQLYQSWTKKINSWGNNNKPSERSERAILQIAHNIEDEKYSKNRLNAIVDTSLYTAEIPELLRPEWELLEHQVAGVSWLQSLFNLSPKHISGCLLADDMGLGKTIQILSFIVWIIERNKSKNPSLIIAPVSLLDNWERELHKFFYADTIPVLKLYGDRLKELKFTKKEIPFGLQQKGIKNLLRPGWVNDSKIVLTTYETMRDQEFSLARQEWSVVICDEAQKIKNPAALVTQAANAIPSRFKIACTGTPVENTLTDLWALFDFIQPGYLVPLNQFGKEYQRPIESNVGDSQALERLRRLVEPQILRRTKSDVAKDLPLKIEDVQCRSIPMSTHQKKIYLSSVSAYIKNESETEQSQSSAGILGLLHRLKLICAHPFCVEPDPKLRDNSPKMNWLIHKLHEIKENNPNDKVIIFTELRDIQRELQHTVYKQFGFKPIIINGDTSTNSESSESRQKLIDRFQEQNGFGVIILSTVAVGFGVNVQAANHVIHFTRCWNPAKEDQATDRAYRIGQKKDVYVNRH
ncbi:type I Zorya anti-phage system protein ZorD [Tolumonas osonensis]|uniref:SNF2 family DNA or RNA helicase n=1 Tax=Tolumonas osonensis TaxID=675874 RepID=A0A841GBP2_9GAMM|nr:type I Zorya anti-phage system protein ZorD [Tolumonas osonensis]MBB6055359.1 SNF2 family DNA or RNA helicase [Tolumonas osonensis]